MSKKKFVKLICFFLIIWTIPLLGKKEKSSYSFQKGRFERSSRDTQIPKSLAKSFKKKYFDKLKKTEETSQNTEQPPRRNLFLKIEITQEKYGGPLEHFYRFFSPRGGGVIDLKNYILGGKGFFKINFWPYLTDDMKGLPLKNINVYYVSGTKRQKLKDHWVGTECGHYLNLTKYYNEEVREDGILLDTSHNQYLNVIGGTFFFVHPRSEGLYIASLTFEDSRHLKVRCK